MVAERSEPHFYLISAISTFFDKRIETLLSSNHFPSNRRYLRSWLTEWSIEDFKIEKINEVLSLERDKNFIVIFDNSDASLSLAQTIQKKFPGRVLAIYLRQVVKKDLPQHAIGFYTAFDIALNEYQKQRISLPELESIAQTVLNETQRESLFPDYAICPKDYDPCSDKSSGAASICARVRLHIQRFQMGHSERTIGN